MIRNTVLAAISLFSVSAAFGQPAFPAASGSSTSSSTSTTYTPQPMALPPFGLGSTETARIDVMNTAAASSSGTAASCTGSVAFYNSSGTIIGTSTTYTLGTNQISSVSLPFADAGLTSPRGEITAIVTPTTSTSTTSAPPCQLRVTVSTFDSTTGATHLFSGGGPGGPGGPPMGPPPQQ